MKRHKIKNYVGLKRTDDIVKLYLYGDIGNFFDEDISAAQVQDQIKELNDEKLEIHINSFGGDFFEGITIYNLLNDYPGEIITVIDGMAASAATLIAMSGDKIQMQKSSEILIHNPWTIAMGNASDLLAVAAELEKHESLLFDIYKNKFKGTDKELKALLAEEKFLLPKEALELGLCDEIIEPKESPEEEPEKTVQNKILKLFA